MKTTRRSWWLVFGGGAAAVILALTWITTVVIDLEHEGLAARVEADYQSRLRLAMWRMEDWLGRRIDHESDRPWVEYQSYYAQQPAYTSILNEIRPGDVYIPSPLLTHDSEFFPLHFQLTADDVLTSPQVPEGNFRDLAESEYGIAETIAVKSKMLLTAKGSPRGSKPTTRADFASQCGGWRTGWAGGLITNRIDPGSSTNPTTRSNRRTRAS